MVRKAKPKVKNAIKDPDMCQCVKNNVDDIVDNYYEDIVEEIEYNLMVNYY